jgi:1-acylglycerone phosphate reductase
MPEAAWSTFLRSAASSRSLSQVGSVAFPKHLPRLIGGRGKGIYNAAKAALIQGSETWRHELAPLGVRTITLVSGGIATNFMARLSEGAKLPETSHYLAVKDVVEHVPSENPYGVKPEAFANDLVKLVEKGSTGKIWLGGGVAVARPALWLLPQKAVDGMVENMRPFSKRLAKEYKRQDP